MSQNPFWPLNTTSLPLEGAPDDSISEDYTIEFRLTSYGRVKAIVTDSWGFIIDIVIGSDFTDAYETVREQYPQASWESRM